MSYDIALEEALMKIGHRGVADIRNANLKGMEHKAAHLEGAKGVTRNGGRK